MIILNNHGTAVNTTGTASSSSNTTSTSKPAQTGGLHNSDNCELQEKQTVAKTPLEDKDHKGKPRPWQRKKAGTMQLTKAFREQGHKEYQQGSRVEAGKEYKRANRIFHCGSHLAFTQSSINDKLALKEANFCRERLCVLCNWRKSIKMFYELSRIYDIAHKENPVARAIFITLTIKNCSGEDLSATLDRMYKAWNKMLAHSRIKAAGFLGWFRALEVTHNWQRNDYHPHFHAIVMVDKSYFKSDAYLEAAELVKIWKVSLGVDYDPICDMRKVYSKGEQKHKAVAEVAKYTLKDSDYLFKGDDKKTALVVGVLSPALRGRRLYAYGGVLREIAKRLKVAKYKDLVKIDDNSQISEEIASLLLIYKWDFGLRNYFCRT